MIAAAAGPARFGEQPPFRLGIEEELLLVDPGSLALRHHATDVLARMAAPEAHPDVYEALVEFSAPVADDAPAGATALSALRAGARAAGATLIGAGIHPDGARGDVEHVDDPRYDQVAEQLRGLVRRTPTCALHVHVGMPDAETAIRVFNGLREWLALLQALGANSPFWHGADSGLASSRAQLFRGYPRADIPQAFASFDAYASSVEAVCRAGDLPDYTFLWWDLRPHPKLGTVEVRAMDAQSPLWAVEALAGLVHGLALHAAEHPVEASPREALMESSFRAARDGMAATLWHDGALRPVAEVLEAALLRAPQATSARRFLLDGNGAARQRAAHERGGMRAVLELLRDEAARPYG